MDRLEAVADIGQRSGDDHAHRVIEVAHPHLVLDADGPDVADIVGHGLASPGVNMGSGKRSRWAAGPGRPSLAGEAGDGRARPRRRRRARATPDPVETEPDRGGCVGRQLRQGVADDPRAVAIGRRGGQVGLTFDERENGRRIDLDERPERPRQRLLDVRLVVADELVDERDAVLGDVRRPAAAVIDERQGRHRRADQAALPAGRREHEALELGPAVPLEDDPPADGMGEAVDRDPVAGLPGRAAQELPGAFRVLGQEPVEEAEREPARLELRLVEQAVGDLQVATARSRRVAARNPRSMAAVSGQRTPYVRPMPGAIRCVPAR